MSTTKLEEAREIIRKLLDECVTGSSLRERSEAFLAELEGEGEDGLGHSTPAAPSEPDQETPSTVGTVEPWVGTIMALRDCCGTCQHGGWEAERAQDYIRDKYLTCCLDPTEILKPFDSRCSRWCCCSIEDLRLAGTALLEVDPERELDLYL